MVGVGVAFSLGEVVVLMWEDVGFFCGARPGVKIASVDLGMEGRMMGKLGENLKDFFRGGTRRAGADVSTYYEKRL